LWPLQNVYQNSLVRLHASNHKRPQQTASFTASRCFPTSIKGDTNNGPFTRVSLTSSSVVNSQNRRKGDRNPRYLPPIRKGQNQNTESKMTVFWDAAPCSLVETDRCFEGTYCLHHHSSTLCLIYLFITHDSNLVSLGVTTPAVGISSSNTQSVKPRRADRGRRRLRSHRVRLSAPSLSVKPSSFGYVFKMQPLGHSAYAILRIDLWGGKQEGSSVNSVSLRQVVRVRTD
jgi:hypothetical protein